MKKKGIFIFLLLALVAGMASWLLLREKKDIRYAKRGDVVELSFELDKKLEFGEYYFDLANATDATFPLCFCLTERNTYPPDCSGDVKYLYKNHPGTMCIPLKIGNGNCSVQPIITMGYATSFIIPREYAWTKPFEKIVIGIRVPQQASNGDVLAVAITLFKQNALGKMETIRSYEKQIEVVKS